MIESVYIVMLRQPRRSDPTEKRSDPFWEFGSFGCTRCHRTNLLNPKRAERLEGARLAFAQGGPAGFRLVFVTPPITVRNYAEFVETCWPRGEMPLRYDFAPILIDNRGKSDFAYIKTRLEAVKRNTWVQKFSSRFRSCTTPFEGRRAADLLTTFESFCESSGPQGRAKRYNDALPFDPPCIDLNRHQTLLGLRGSLEKAVKIYKAGRRNVSCLKTAGKCGKSGRAEQM